MKVFVAGPRAITKLNNDVKDRLLSVISKGYTVLVGDANGVDRLTQQYLLEQQYKDVIVYASNGVARNNLGYWPVKSVAVMSGIKGFEFYAYKDRQMAADADYGFMIWNGKSKGTLNNIINLTKASKRVLLYFVPHKKFYCINSSDEAEKLSIACGEGAQALFSTLTSPNKSHKLNTSDHDIEQLTLFG